MVAAARGAYASHGVTGPPWVTEMGYPSSQTFQYDRSF